ncbi:restriction endonuclease subunit S [Microbacterium azadirachtae]|uniref:EcoKI restriction-modification system protein HsdS n=1 Tax=Microbacterium azadirachtae TaxID=582680 RepID=A0A0F0LPH8_9MICO|nr:restriction endonuclease subunit S [Microbacterium azadirachtae]KJL34594.1 hypothetical protein RS86_00849 [Microbacterium azadirachtae]
MNVAFGELVEFAVGGGWGEEQPSDGMVPVRVIRGADFPAAESRNLASAPLRYERSKKAASRTLREGDIVLEVSGGTKDRPTGRSIFVSPELLSSVDHDVIPASFCRLVRIDRSKASPAFVYYALKDLYDRGGTWEYQNQSTGISNFQFETFRARWRLDVPPVHEQQAIAEVLGALDDKIAANTALAVNTEQVLRAEVDVAWLRREDRSSTLADFVEFNPKVSVPRSESAIYIDMKRLPESGWSIDGYDHREPKGGARFQNGDTLMARITPCLENRKTGFVDHLEDGAVGIGSTEFIVMRARHGIAAPTSFLLATEARFREFAIQHMIGTSGRQRVAASDLAAFELPTPDFAWLDQFGRRADALFAAVAAQARENRTLAATRDALLPQLMSGKLRVRDAEAAASRRAGA